MTENFEHTPELEAQMEAAVTKVGYRMADDFEAMGQHIREATDAEDFKNISLNLNEFIRRLTKGMDSVDGYLHRHHLTAITEAQAEDMDLEYVEDAMHHTAEFMEDLVSHIERHVPAGEWHSLAYDLRGAISLLQVQLSGLRIWSRRQEILHGPKLDDSEMYGKMIWRNPDAE